MRILHVLDHSLPLQSGYVFRTLGIVNEQRALGWEPILLTSGKHNLAGAPRERIGEWEFYRTASRSGAITKVGFLANVAAVIDLRRRLEEVLREVRPDILHAHSPVLNALAVIPAGHKAGIPV